MNRLYVLGFTHDLKGVVFTQRKGGKKPTFWVPVDPQFLRALDKLQKARKAPKTRAVEVGPPRRDGKVVLPPVGRSQARTGLPASEIQQMLREGKTIKTVAAAAKTELTWIERLAEPVMTERQGVVRLAQRAYMSRARLGAAGLQLGEAVERNLEDKGTTPDGVDAVWDARVMTSGIWRISMRFTNRGKRRAAEWEFRKGSRTITPRNRLGAQLGWWAPEPPEEPDVDDTGADAEEAEAPHRLPARDDSVHEVLGDLLGKVLLDLRHRRPPQGHWLDAGRRPADLAPWCQNRWCRNSARPDAAGRRRAQVAQMKTSL